MQFARIWKSLPFRRGAGVQANLRLTAGVGVVATCLLVAGPSATVAFADPGGHGHSSHGNNNNASKKKTSNGDGPATSRNGSDYSDDNINDGTNSTEDERPTSKVGSGRESGTSDERPTNDYNPSSPGP